MVFFDLDDQEESIGFGTYALIMYYAKTINETEAKKFFDATLTEYEYRVNYAFTGYLTDAKRLC